MRRIFVAALLSVVLGAVGTRAETDSTGSNSPTLLKDTIIVTADRFGESSARSVWPAAAVTLNSNQDQSSVKQALDGKYGLDIRETSGLGSLATLSSWGTFNRHMLLLYNGRVVKDYSLGGFNLADWSLDEFDRIEILKGPQSALYGSDAVGGVINLISPSALVDRVNLTTRVGSFDTHQYRIDASRAFGRVGLAGFAEFGATHNGRPNSGSQRDLFGLRSEYLSANSRHHVTISARYFTDSLGLPGPVPDQGFIPVYGNSQSYSLNQRQQDEDYSADFSYQYFDKSAGEAHLDAFWEKKNLDYNMLYNYQSYYYSANGADSSLNIDSVDVHTRSIYNKRSSGVSGRFLKEMGIVRWSSGIDWLSGSLRATSDNRSLGTNIVGPTAPYQYAYNNYAFWSRDQNQLDIWGAGSVQAITQVNVNLSGRLQYVRGRKTQPSYDLGTIVTPVEHFRLKLAYGYAFRLPSIADQFADDFYTSGNLDLDPETSRSLIFTTEGELASGRLKGAVTVFSQTVHSLIQYVYEPATFKSVPRNVDRFRSRGIDFSLSALPAESLTVSVSGVWQKAEQTNGGTDQFISAFYVPGLKWRLGAEKANLIRRVTVGTGLTYTSDRYVLLYGGLPKTINAVYEVEASVSARVTRSLSMVLSAYDLTNQKRPDQIGYTITDGDFPSPGRRFSVQARFSAF